MRLHGGRVGPAGAPQQRPVRPAPRYVCHVCKRGRAPSAADPLAGARAPALYVVGGFGAICRRPVVTYSHLKKYSPSRGPQGAPLPLLGPGQGAVLGTLWLARRACTDLKACHATCTPAGRPPRRRPVAPRAAPRVDASHATYARPAGRFAPSASRRPRVQSTTYLLLHDTLLLLLPSIPLHTCPWRLCRKCCN